MTKGEYSVVENKNPRDALMPLLALSARELSLFRNMPAYAEADQVGEKVIEIIARTQRLPAGSVTLDSTFEQLKIDSLDGINVVFELEKEFDIEIPDEGVTNLRSVRDTVEGVRQLIEKKARTVPPSMA